MRNMVERRLSEVRAAPGRRIIGAVMRYGSSARVITPDGERLAERFEPGAFRESLASGREVRLNLQHDPSLTVATTGDGRVLGNLRLRDSERELSMEARLPSGDVFDRVLRLVDEREFAETSVEFVAHQERREGGMRTIQRAALEGIGIVAHAAYGAAGKVEVRRDGGGLSGRVHYGRDRVTADRGKRRKQRFVKGAFSYTLTDESREILLVIGDAQHVLASRRAGSLHLRDTDEALEFAVEALPDVSYAADFRALLATGAIAPGVMPMVRIPPPEVVPEAVEYVPEEGNPDVEIEVVHSAILTALAIRYRAPRGNPGEVELRGAPAAARRRRRIWL